MINEATTIASLISVYEPEERRIVLPGISELVNFMCFVWS